MRYYYAQVNEAGICTGVTDAHVPIIAPHMIQVDSADPAYIGRTWADGAWLD